MDSKNTNNKGLPFIFRQYSSKTVIATIAKMMVSPYFMNILFFILISYL